MEKKYILMDIVLANARAAHVKSQVTFIRIIVNSENAGTYTVKFDRYRVSQIMPWFSEGFSGGRRTSSRNHELKDFLQKSWWHTHCINTAIYHVNDHEWLQKFTNIYNHFEIEKNEQELFQLFFKKSDFIISHAS